MEGGYGLTGSWDSLWDWETGEHCEPRDGSHGTGEHCNAFGSLWDWQTGDHCEPRDGSYGTGEHCEPRDGSHAETDATQSLWDFLNQDDDVLGLLGNQTPLPDCYDFFTDLGDITFNETLDLEESHKSKRRRTLEYPSESSQPEVGSHETGPPFVTSEVAEVSLPFTEEPQSLNCDMDYTSNNLDTVKSMSNEAPHVQEDNHLEHCSYGTPVYIEPDQVPCSQVSIACIDDQAGISGTSEIAQMTESSIMQETRKLSTLKVSKGNQRITSIAIAYNFALIREEGGVTLKDINQRINAPPKKATEILGTSAFSGRLVTGKKEGRGSVTILRTKG